MRRRRRGPIVGLHDFNSSQIKFELIQMKIIKLAKSFLHRNSLFIVLFQVLLVSFSLFLAWLLRFDLTLPYRRLLAIALIPFVMTRLLAMGVFGLFHGWWKYTGLNEALDVSKAVVAGSAAWWLVASLVPTLRSFPRSLYLLEPLLTGTLLIGVRAFSRVLAESVRQDANSCKRVVVIGAGIAGQTAVREIKRSDGYAVIGYLDDDVSKHSLRLGGVSVIGAVERLINLKDEYHIDEVLIAVPSASGREMRRFVEICEQARIKFRTLPALSDIITGNVGINEFRDVCVEDLLGRDPIEIDLEAVRRKIAKRSIAVTGAAGSIGSELCRQILQYGPARLLCIDKSETGMFYLQQDLSKAEGQARIFFTIGDVGDAERMEQLFCEHRPEIVFHAAAYKHVPVMEANIREAVRNNVFALKSLLDVAAGCECDSFVMISTDKAVNPTSVMGATKRIGELIISARPDSGLRCVSVRFGNVLGSSGSVVPLFQEQLRRREPLTITHPDTNRFFMTTREAVSLVLQAFAIGKHGETLVLDMGAPVRIVDLARTLIRLSGRSEEEVEIRYTGLRDGEKLVETLFYPSEEVQPTSFSKIKKARNGIHREVELTPLLEELRDSLAESSWLIRAKMKDIVPEFTYRSPESDRKNPLEQRISAVGTD